MDVLVALISQESTTWLVLHVLCSLEESNDEKSVNDTQNSACLRATTSRHSCWFHCLHTSCRDLPHSLHLREQSDVHREIEGEHLSV